MLKPILLVASALIPVLCSAQSPAIPPAFQDTFNDVNASLSSFENTLSGVWDGSSYPVLHGANLQTATSNLTTSLLNPNYYQGAVLSELNSLQALGAKAVTIQINFPVLYPGYYSDSAQYQAFANFYSQLATDVHARGLKLIVENTTSVPYPGTNSGSFAPYLQSLDWPTYQAQRAQLAANIARVVQPDYLILLEEPDTEASVTGQSSVNTVAGATQMLQSMVAAVQAANVPNVQLGAGCGTWNPNFLQFEQSFATLPIPYVDMHIYPVNQNNLPNALNAVGVIQAAGKQPTLSEMWSYKESNTDYVANLPYTTVFARDVYSLWSSTDIAFLKAMSDFTNYGHFAFSSPFWSHYLMAYLDYATYGGQPDTTVISAAGVAANQAIAVGAFTATGLSFENSLIPALDQTAPTVPAPPIVQGYSQTAATIIWNPTTDNVGVAAYNLYRNNVLVATVNSPLLFVDQGLSASTTYNYTLTAFDASGNVSPMSAPLTFTTLSTPDRTPPSTPSNVQAVPFADTQINLSWTSSTDNVGITAYMVYRGTSASSINPYATVPSNSFLDTNGVPSKTYYYQVDAIDNSGNHSPRSAIFSATTLADTVPPTTPGNISLTTSPGPSVTITWSASTDDYYLASYQIWRGTNASNLQMVGGTPASTLTFTDTHVSSGKTYYYTVIAVDSAGNTSASRTPASIVAYPDTTPPTVPANVQGSSPSDTRVNLTWSASTDSIGMYGYTIYRGTSPSNTTTIGTSTTPSFADSTVAPGKTYYYQIDAIDTSSNHSAKSAAIAVNSLPDTTPPSTPQSVVASAQSGPSVSLSWRASTDDYCVGSYQILRGTTASNLTLYAAQAATSPLTYSDTRVSSGKTFFYAVAAVDVAGNVSVQSTPISVTLP